MRKSFVLKAGIAAFAMSMMMTTVAMADPNEKVEENNASLVVTNESCCDGVASLAGISGVLNNYYTVVETGDYSRTIEVEMTALVDDEMALKASVLSDYDNLGIALVSSYLNVREKPSSSNNSKIIGKMIQNTACEILDVSSGWYKIKSGPVTGYVSAEYIVTGDEAMEIALQEAKLRAVVATSKGNELNVREKASTSSKILEKVSSDERYEVLEILDGWVKIATVTGEGYVSADYVEVKYALNEAVEFTPPMTSSKRQGIIEYAQRFVGGKYVFGGTSLTKGIDCSAFVQQIYAKFGISLPRTSKPQSKCGRSVSWSQIQPGDLIFYGRSGVSGVGHVAIYIGNGKIVHAASERLGITISNARYTTILAIKNVID